jgi:hypothetical protein
MSALHEQIFAEIQGAWRNGQTVTFSTPLRHVPVSAAVAEKFASVGRPFVKLTAHHLKMLEGKRYVRIATPNFLTVRITIT